MFHGFFAGISPSLMMVDDINQVNRFEEPDESGLLCDLLWSDPHEDFDEIGGTVR
jgi:serine/threonine-protein phosphatase 2B catalytic subunit